jgi:hypothetical protein
VHTTIGEVPDSRADVNHWMSYAFANERTGTIATMLITHPDDPYKVNLIRSTLGPYVDVGICMSSEVVAQLHQAGVPSDRLCYVLFGHDGLVTPRRLTIGITTRLYADGRKRENLLLRLANDVDMTAFRFLIFGSGWEPIAERLRAAGAVVSCDVGTDNYLADYQRIVRAVPEFDYYLYLGMDEGSLGTLDALAAGVGTIVTDQGFHRDIASVITHPFVAYEELREIFRTLAERRQVRIDVAKQLTWEAYAQHHVSIWRLLKEGNRVGISSQIGNSDATKGTTRYAPVRFWARSLHPRRALSALSHVPMLRQIAAFVRDWRRRQ